MQGNPVHQSTLEPWSGQQSQASSSTSWHADHGQPQQLYLRNQMVDITVPPSHQTPSSLVSLLPDQMSVVPIQQQQHRLQQQQQHQLQQQQQHQQLPYQQHSINLGPHMFTASSQVPEYSSAPLAVGVGLEQAPFGGSHVSTNNAYPTAQASASSQVWDHQFSGFPSAYTSTPNANLAQAFPSFQPYPSSRVPTNIKYVDTNASPPSYLGTTGSSLANALAFSGAAPSQPRLPDWQYSAAAKTEAMPLFASASLPQPFMAVSNMFDSAPLPKPPKVPSSSHLLPLETIPGLSKAVSKPFLPESKPFKPTANSSGSASGTSSLSSTTLSDAIGGVGQLNAKANYTQAAADAVKKPAKPSLLSKARSLLLPAAIEADPAHAARQLITLLSDLEDGRFRKPKPTNFDTRMEIVEAIEGSKVPDKACSKDTRIKYLSCWVGSAAGRCILSAWLKQTIPPKNSTVPDLSPEYRKTLIPLLSLLFKAPVKLEHLQDKVAGLGGALTGVINRAASPSVREAATVLKEKWHKLAASSTAPTTGAASSSTAKRPNEEASSSIKRVKTSVGSAASTAANLRQLKTSSSSSTPLPAVAKIPLKPTAALAAPAAAKAAVSFFATQSAKPAVAAAKRPTTMAAAAGSKKPKTTHQDILNFIDMFDKPATGKATGSSNDESSNNDSTSSGSGSKKKMTKRKKSVRWKPDSELVAVKVFELYEEEINETVTVGGDSDGGYNGGGYGELDHAEGSALRHAHAEMEETVAWYAPAQILIVSDNPERGCESQEAILQDERERTLAEVVYPEGEEPASPDESLVQEAEADPELPAGLHPQSQEMVLGAEVEPFHKEDEPGYLAPSFDHALYPNQAQANSLAPPISELLAKLGVPAGSTESTPAAAANVGQAQPAMMMGSDSILPTFDIGKLNSILANLKAIPPVSNTTTASSTGEPTGAATQVSTLLASLSSSLGGGGSGVDGHQAEVATSQTYGTASEEVDGGNSYWSRMYRNSDKDMEAANYQQQQPYEYEDHQYGRNGGGSNGYNQSAAYENYQQERNDWGRHPHHGGGGPAVVGYKVRTVPCRYWKMGNCRRGDQCHFQHD